MRRKRREAMESAAPFLPIAMGAMSVMNVVEFELRSRTRMRFEGEAALQAAPEWRPRRRRGRIQRLWGGG